MGKKKARLYEYEYEADGYAQTDGTVKASSIEEAKRMAEEQAQCDGIVSVNHLHVRRLRK